MSASCSCFARAEYSSAGAEKDVAEIPLLEERIAALDQAIGRMRPRPALVSEHTQTKKQMLDADSKWKEALAAHKNAKNELATASFKLRDTDETLSAVKFDPAMFDALDATREDASRIVNWRHTLTTSAAEVQTTKGHLKVREEGLARADAAAEVVEREWKRAFQWMHDAEQELADARHRDAVAILRRELRIGEACPVCEQPVADHPPPLPTPSFDAVLRKCEQAKRTESTARELMDKAKAAATDARVTVVAEQQNVDDASKRCTTAEAELATACQSLARRVSGVIAVTEEQNIDEQVGATYQVVAAAKRRHETLRQSRENADKAVQRWEQSCERLKGVESMYAAQVEQCKNKIVELARQITEIDEEVRKVTQASDPKAERAQLSLRRNQLATALQASQQAMTKSSGELHAAVARLEASEETFKRAKADTHRARDQAREAAITAGFADEAVAAQAEMTRSDEQRISKQVEAYRNECRTLKARITELTNELRGAEVAEETLAAAEMAATQLRTDLGAAERSETELKTRIEILTKAIDRAKELRADLDRLRTEHSLYRSLALELRSDRFQAFLLQQTFQELVSGASVRLWDLTKRYRFDWQNEAFYVVDHDNARQLRSADTLSGGETFLASLALALQLSEQVQKAAGATKLDSLFIDEGFGTLDPEALDAAASAIESLPVGGRMVGIISHIEELSLRLPARVRVRRTPDGSRLVVEGS